MPKKGEKTEKADDKTKGKKPEAKAEKPKAAASAAKEEAAAAKPGSRRILGVIALIVIVILVIAGGLVYGVNQSQPTSFATFKSNFNGAKDVAILVTADNGTALSATVGCATTLIASIVGESSPHRNASTIGFYVLNKTICVYSSTPLGSSINNFTNSTPSQCINATAATPRIFINYSAVNSTSITPTSLYIAGNTGFLAECGVASELTSR